MMSIFLLFFLIISNKINCNQKNNDQIWMKNKLKNCFKKFKGVNQGEEKKKISSMTNWRYANHTRHPGIEGLEANVWGLDYASWSTWMAPVSLIR